MLFHSDYSCKIEICDESANMSEIGSVICADDDNLGQDRLLHSDLDSDMIVVSLFKKSIRV